MEKSIVTSHEKGSNRVMNIKNGKYERHRTSDDNRNNSENKAKHPITNTWANNIDHSHKNKNDDIDDNSSEVKIQYSERGGHDLDKVAKMKEDWKVDSQCTYSSNDEHQSKNWKHNKGITTHGNLSSKNNILINPYLQKGKNKQLTDLASYNSNNSSSMLNNIITIDSSYGKIRDMSKSKQTPLFIQDINKKTSLRSLMFGFNNNNNSNRNSLTQSREQSLTIKKYKSIRDKNKDEFIRSCSGEHCNTLNAWQMEKSASFHNFESNLKALGEWIDLIKNKGFKKGKENVIKKTKLTKKWKTSVNTINTQVCRIEKLNRAVNKSTTKWDLETSKCKGVINWNVKKHSEFTAEILDTRKYNASITLEREKVKEETKIINELIIIETNELEMTRGIIAKVNNAISDCSKEKERYWGKMCLLRKQIQNLRAKINFEFTKTSGFMLNVDELCIEQNWYDKGDLDEDR